jgi:hypothetical protein
VQQFGVRDLPAFCGFIGFVDNGSLDNTKDQIWE